RRRTVRHHEAKHRPNSHRPRGQRAAARRSARRGAGQGRGQARRREGPRRAAAGRGGRGRAQADRPRHRYHRRWRVRQTELRLLRQRTSRRLRVRQRGAAKPVGGLARSPILPGVLRRRPRGRPPAAPRGPPRQNHMVCTAPITYRGMAQLKTDIDNLKAALDGAKPQEAFMPAISPTSAADWQRNGYYKTEEEYLFAIADALREEYEAIVKAGLLLQVDDPHLVTYWIKEPDLTLEQFRKWAGLRVEALNHALRNIPPEKVRHHTCYGINMGPRVHDLELKHIVDLILKIRA